MRLRQKALQEQQFERGEDPASIARIGGNGLPVKDPNAPDYSGFYLMVTGHIQSGTFEDRDGICCSFDMIGGPDWQ